MIRSIILIVLALFTLVSVGHSQSERKSIRQGNREFNRENFLESEISYRSALELNPESFKANFNLGDALYKQENYEAAKSIFEDLANLDLDPIDRAKVFHNLGNSYFQQQEFGESVEAYKNALRNNPNDMETKYNLAQAQRMLMEQEQEQEQDCDGDGEGENDEQNDQQDQQDGDDDQENKQQDQQQQDQQEQEQQISSEDARRMLEAILNNEQEIQDRVREEQAKQQRVEVERNW